MCLGKGDRAPLVFPVVGKTDIDSFMVAIVGAQVRLCTLVVRSDTCTWGAPGLT